MKMYERRTLGTCYICGKEFNDKEQSRWSGMNACRYCANRARILDAFARELCVRYCIDEVWPDTFLEQLIFKYDIQPTIANEANHNRVAKKRQLGIGRYGRYVWGTSFNDVHFRAANLKKLCNETTKEFLLRHAVR